MNKIIYAIKIGQLSYGGELKIIDVKIGQTMNIESALHQYRRSNPDAEILDLWEVNPSKNSWECEQGIHKIAEKYAYERKREKFIFLQESYQNFAENVSLLLRKVTVKDKEKIRIKRKKKETGYIGKKPAFIKFREKKYKVNTWREMLCVIAEKIYKDKKDLTPALKIKGRKRIYFSKNNRELVDPQEIKGSPYFCEGNLNANHIVKIVKKLLNIFGYSEQDLEIVCK